MNLMLHHNLRAVSNWLFLIFGFCVMGTDTKDSEADDWIRRRGATPQ